MVNKIDIIGNGASNHLYTPRNRQVIACNVPQHKFYYNVLSIIDNKPVHWMRTTKWTPQKPVYCTPVIAELAKKVNLAGDWFPVYEEKHRWNSGHHAVYKHRTANEIHLWGFDSMFSDNLTSQCDAIIPRSTRPPLNKHWHPIWCEILDQTSADVYVHMPDECELLFAHSKLYKSTQKTQLSFDFDKVD